jgi:hypothetical protein
LSKQFSAKAEFSFSDPHRETVTEAVLNAAQHLRKNRQGVSEELAACIFSGAFATDINLGLLLNYFSRINIVSSDKDLLEKGLATQGLKGSHRVTAVSGIDVGGISDRLVTAATTGLGSDPGLNELMDAAQTVTWDGLPKQVDVNASVCVLSQLIAQLVESVGEQHDQFLPLVQAVRWRHLQLLLQQLRPGGVGILVFEFVSSDSIPALPQLAGEDLDRTLAAAIDAGNFFHGLNPQVMVGLFQNQLRDQIKAFQLSRPWVWKTPERAYAVTALMFQKA